MMVIKISLKKACLCIFLSKVMFFQLQHHSMFPLVLNAPTAVALCRASGGHTTVSEPLH